MKRFLLLFLLLMTLSTVTVSCSAVDSAQHRVNMARHRIELALGLESTIFSSDSTVLEKRESENLGFIIATLALIGIAVLAIAAMVLSNSYV